MNKALLLALGMKTEVERIERGQCPTCGKDMDSQTFKDELSAREYSISGMCQQCQDKTFEEPQTQEDHDDAP